MIIDRLAIALGYEYDPKKMEKFNSGVEKSKKLVKGLSITAIGLATSFALLFNKLSGNALNEGRFAKAVDLSRESLVAFKRTSESLTGSSGAATSLIEKLFGIRNAFKANGTVNELFLRGLQKMGISWDEFIDSDPEQSLFDIAKGFQSVSDFEKDALTHLLGLNTQGRNFLGGLTREKFLENMPTEADLEKMQKFEDSIRELKHTFGDLILVLGTPLVDKINPILHKIAVNAKAIITPLLAVVDVIESVGEALGNIAGFTKVEILDPLFKENKNFNEEFSPLFPSIGFQSDKAKKEFSLSIKNEFHTEITTDNPEIAGDIIQEKVERSNRQALENFKGEIEN